MLEFVSELFAEFFVWLWRALVGLLRFLFRFDLLVDVLVELWCGLLELFGYRKTKPGSGRPDQPPD